MKENFLKSFLQHRPVLSEARQDGAFDIVFNFTEPGASNFPSARAGQSVWWTAAETKMNLKGASNRRNLS